MSKKVEVKIKYDIILNKLHKSGFTDIQSTYSAGGRIITYTVRGQESILLWHSHTNSVGKFRTFFYVLSHAEYRDNMDITSSQKYRTLKSAMANFK